MQQYLATASSVLIRAAISEMIPQRHESAQILTTVTIPDGENISDDNGPTCQCLRYIILGTTETDASLEPAEIYKVWLQSHNTDCTCHRWKSVFLLVFFQSHSSPEGPEHSTNCENQRIKRLVRPSKMPRKK